MLPSNRETAAERDYTEWSDFDVEEYVTRNFGRKMLDEDRLLILEVIQYLKSHNISPKSWKKVADVGAGPNLYPAMLMAPLVKPPHLGGQIDLIEYASPNRAYLKSVLANQERPRSLEGTWHKFEELMAGEAHQWQGALSAVRQKAQVIAGSIFELPHDYYDAISAYYVPESITDDIDTCQKAVHCLIESLKRDGFIMVAHMLGSQGWPAGLGTNFPAVSLDMAGVENLYKGKARVKVVKVAAAPGCRDGYHGMAVVIGNKVGQLG